MWEYLGGALASEYAAELQVQYAPELALDGMAIGGVSPNMTELFGVVNGMPYAALIPLNLVGLTKAYPKSREYLLSVLKPDGPYNRMYFMNTENLSAVQASAAFANQSIWDYFVNGRQDIRAPLIQNILNDNSYMGYHGVPQMPVFLFKAIHDEVAPIDGVDALVDRYCSIGADILYERNTVGTHPSEMYYQDGSAFEWLSSVLDGIHVARNGTSGFTVRNVTVSSPSAST